MTESSTVLSRDEPLIDIRVWSRFTRRIMSVLIASALLIGGAVAGVSIVQQRDSLRENLRRRSQTLLRALARSAFVPTMLEDRAALDPLLEGFVGEIDVVYAGVLRADGTVLAQRPGDAALALDAVPSGLLERRVPRPGRSTVVDLVMPLRYGTPTDPDEGEVAGYVRIGLADDRFREKVLAAMRYQGAILLGVTAVSILFGAILIRHMTRSMRNLIERVQATAELERTNKELESFSYSVSHDLRAPLRSIDGFSHALLEDYSDRLDEAGKDYLNRVRAACQNMGQLIDDLLGLSRVIRHELRFEEVDLTATVRSIVAQLTQSEPDRRVHVEIAEGVRAQGDPGLLRIVLENLLNNAWKFTRKTSDPRIEFGTLEKDGVPVMFVRDNGAGFDMSYADKLFGAFQRLHEAREFPGTGIGLATVHRIVHRHGGRVWAEAAVGKGATFSFALPRHPITGIA